jgi:hypothetical protein
MWYRIATVENYKHMFQIVHKEEYTLQFCSKCEMSTLLITLFLIHDIWIGVLIARMKHYKETIQIIRG